MATRVLRKALLESSKGGETVNSSFTTYQTGDSGNVTSLNLSLPALLTTGKTASHLPGELEKQMNNAVSQTPLFRRTMWRSLSKYRFSGPFREASGAWECAFNQCSSSDRAERMDWDFVSISPPITNTLPP